MKRFIIIFLAVTGCTSVIIPEKDKEDLVGIQEYYSQEFSIDSTSIEVWRLFRHQKNLILKPGTLLVDKKGEKITMTLKTEELTLSRKFRCQPNGKMTKLWTVG